MEWQLQEAKNKFSEVIKRATTEGPQEITKHGKKTAVIISFEEYKKIRQKESNLVDFFADSPLEEIEITRDKDLPRKADF